MIRSTQGLIGVALLALAAVFVGLAFVDQEAQATRIPDVLAGRDRATLLAIPQPPMVPLLGGDALVPNQDYRDTASWQKAWTAADGTRHHAVYALTLASANGTTTQWDLLNTTRLAGAAQPHAITRAGWTLEGYLAVPADDFADGDAYTPRLWTLIPAQLVREPLQPKPSQFTGGLLRTLPDGTPLPDGALLWAVEDFKVGCSSKFLPPEERERRKAAGDL